MLYSVKFAVVNRFEWFNPKGNVHQLRATLLQFESWISTASHLELFYRWKLLQALAATFRKSLIWCLLQGEVSWCGVVLARDGWSCCGHWRAKVEGVVEHASWTELANTKAAIVRAHRLILYKMTGKEK
jgi:hypothetical protein